MKTPTVPVCLCLMLLAVKPPMLHAIRILLGPLMLTSCLGQGQRQVQRLEQIYGMPMHEILIKEKPRQIAQRRRAGEPIEIVGEKPDNTRP